MLVRFLQTGHGIAFGQLFAMTEYPQDVMPLYAEGYSLAEYLIAHGGRQKFVAFLADGMRDGQWPAAVQRHYRLSDLPALQNEWVDWVCAGLPRDSSRASRVLTASAQVPAQPAAASPMARSAADNAAPRPRPEPNLIYHINDKTTADLPPAASGIVERRAAARTSATAARARANQRPPRRPTTPSFRPASIANSMRTGVPPSGGNDSTKWPKPKLQWGFAAKRFLRKGKCWKGR